MRTVVVGLVLAFTLTGCRGGDPVRDVLIDHDGGVDDLIAIAMLLQSPSVRVHAITICPADSYLEPATRATQLFVARLGGRDITIAQGHSEGINPFPDPWRKDAARTLTIPLFEGARPTAPAVAAEDAGHLLAKMLSGDRKYSVLETGPLTNIAAALTLNPAIATNIDRIYVMGGAVRVKGNVAHPGHDASAEWNVFNEPHAADVVLRSGVPVTLVPLDATNKVPLTRAFLERLRAQPSVASTLAAQSWSLVEKQVNGEEYFFWDTLTAAAMLDPGVVATERLHVRVITDGASQGRTVEDPAGSAIDVALDASRERVEQLFLDLLGR